MSKFQPGDIARITTDPDARLEYLEVFGEPRGRLVRVVTDNLRIYNPYYGVEPLSGEPLQNRSEVFVFEKYLDQV